MIALLADSQNTPIRMAWAGWPQAGWNHAGRGSAPTQEAKIPVDSRCFPGPVPKMWNSRSENREKFFRFCGRPIDETHPQKRSRKKTPRENPSPKKTGRQETARNPARPRQPRKHPRGRKNRGSFCSVSMITMTC